MPASYIYHKKKSFDYASLSPKELEEAFRLIEAYLRSLD